MINKQNRKAVKLTEGAGLPITDRGINCMVFGRSIQEMLWKEQIW